MGKGIGKGMRDAAEAIRRKAEARQVKRQLNRCQSDLSDTMERYGAACFAGDAAAEEIRGEAAALRAEAEALERRLDELSGVCRCPDCGTELEEGDAYCRACGRALRRAAPPARIVWPEE